ncbi:MAG: hypothetical protein ABIR80_09165 [Opitutaceae bacterium]
MTAADIRTALHSNKPFKVRTSDGQVIKVPHQDFAALSPDGRTFIVMTEKSWQVLDVFLISAIEMKSSPTAA